MSVAATPRVRLVCVDVDGTMVGSGGEVLPAVWAAVDAARDAGLEVALCTGRPGFGATRGIAERASPGGWHAFQNGASVVNLASGDRRSARIARETVDLLVGRARATGAVLELYQDDGYVVERGLPIAREHARLLGVPFTPRPFEAMTADPVRAQWVLHEETADAILAQPHPHLEVSPSTSPLVPGALFVNLTPLGVDKGSAVRALAEAHGVALEDVMFVGDGWNDVVAMRLVGWPVAVANAEPEAKDLARTVVGHVDDGGLAEALALAIG